MSGPKSRRPPVTATTTSRLITRNLASCVPLQVGVGIVLTGTVVLVVADRCVWGQFFETHLVIMMQAALIVVDKHAGRNVHRIYKGQCPHCGIPSHTPDSRGPGGDRPRTEQPQLNPASMVEDEWRCGSAGRYCTVETSRRQGATNGSS